MAVTNGMDAHRFHGSMENPWPGMSLYTYSRHLDQFSSTEEICCQWRHCQGCLTPNDLKIHWSEAEIWFHCHRGRDSGPNKQGWAEIFNKLGMRLTTISGVPSGNQLPPPAHFSHSSTLHCCGISWQFLGWFWTYRLRSHRCVWFIGLYFVDLLSSSLSLLLEWARWKTMWHICISSSSPVFILKTSAFFHTKLGLDVCPRVNDQPLATLHKS